MGGAIQDILRTAGKALAPAGEALAEGWAKVWSPSVERGYFASGESGLKSIGQVPEMLGQMAKHARDNYESRFSQVIQHRMPLAHDVIKEGNAEQVINDLERKARATDPKAVSLADYDRLLNSALYSEAASQKIKVGPLSGDDFHHMWDPEIFEGTEKDKIVKHLIATGQAPNENKALDIINKHMQSSGGTVHTLQSPRRINLPDYRRDLAVMSDHFGGTIRKIETSKIFGANDEIYDRLLSDVYNQHGAFARDYTKNVIDNILGRGAGYQSEIDRGFGKGWYRKLSSIEAVAHLGLAFISHSGQNLNTAVLAGRGGLGSTARSLGQMIMEHGNAQSFATESGSTFLHAIRTFRIMAGAESESLGSKVLRYTPFSFIDKQRRVFAALVGKNFAESQFEKYLANPKDVRVIRNLAVLGLDPAEIKAAGGLQRDHLLQAAKRMSDISQLRTDALTTPPKWLETQNPLLRMMTMYKQFFYHQTKFIKDQVLKPAFMERELRPLMYMGILFPTFGEIVADMKEVARKGDLKERPGFDKHHWLDRMIDNYSAVGGFGIVGDMINAFAAPDSSPISRYVIGPALSDMLDIGRIPFGKHPVDAIEKKIVQSIPVFGPIASRKMFPPKTHPKGRLQRGMATKAVTKEFNKLF